MTTSRSDEFVMRMINFLIDEFEYITFERMSEDGHVTGVRLTLCKDGFDEQKFENQSTTACIWAAACTLKQEYLRKHTFFNTIIEEYAKDIRP